MKKIITVTSITLFSIISFACMTIDDFNYAYNALEEGLEHELSTCRDDICEINTNSKWKKYIDQLVINYEERGC